MRRVGRSLSRNHGANNHLLVFNMNIVIVNIVLSVLRRFINVGIILCCTPRIFGALKTDASVTLLRAVVIKIVGLAFAILTVVAISGFNHGPLRVVNTLKVTVNVFDLNATFCARTPNVITLLSVLFCITTFTVS